MRACVQKYVCESEGEGKARNRKKYINTYKFYSF